MCLSLGQIGGSGEAQNLLGWQGLSVKLRATHNHCIVQSLGPTQLLASLLRLTAYGDGAFWGMDTWPLSSCDMVATL